MFDQKELILQCLAGNRKAEKQLFDSYSPLFFGICMRYAECEAEAEDMLISGFTKIFKRLESYRGAGSFEAWMKNVMVNNAVDWLRTHPRMARLEAFPDDDSLNQPDVSEFSDASWQLEKEDIAKAIRSLPMPHRSIFNLYAIEGFAHKEIAQMLEMSESTVRVYFSKAKKYLQEMFKDYREDGKLGRTC